jgi:Peptidase M15
VPSEGSVPTQSSTTWAPTGSGRSSLAAAASLAARWGRVTSTARSVEHNRAVGGVPNSYHLLGRAIDIARRPGVTHAMIAAAYRSAGYRLVESLDEGDHSHFAFSFGGWSPPTFAMRRPARPQGTNWGIVTVAGAILASPAPGSP